MVRKSIKTIFFEEMLYFCSRERQNLCQLKKNDFSFNKDSTRACYMCRTIYELTKNRREDEEGFNGCLMNEKPGPNCPVISFELYIGHLNPLNEPQEKIKVSTSEDVWYDNIESLHLARNGRIYCEKQNFPSAAQTIQSGRQLSQFLTSQDLKQGILWPQADIKRNPASEAIAKLSFAENGDVGKPYYKIRG